MDLELIKAWFSSASRDEGRSFIKELCQISLFAELLAEWSGSPEQFRQLKDELEAAQLNQAALQEAAQSHQDALKKAVVDAQEMALRDAIAKDAEIQKLKDSQLEVAQCVWMLTKERPWPSLTSSAILNPAASLS